MKKTLLAVLGLALYVSCNMPSGNPYKDITERTITNLYDAFGKDSTLTKDFGFSCIARYKGKTILFDAGSHAGIFKKNAETLGIDLSAVDIVIVSHGHFDHLNGLDHVLRLNPDVKIYFPYDIFWGAPVPFDATGHGQNGNDALPAHMQYFNGDSVKFFINQSGRFWNANIEFIKTSREVLPGLTLIATHSQYMGYFSCYPGKSFVEGEFDQEQDACKKTNLPELSLAMETENGQALLVGCSHTGVENIIRATKTETAGQIALVYGGFHMIPFDQDQIVKLTTLIRNDLGVHRIAPAHCTGHLAFKELMKAYGKDYLFAGLGETISF